MADSVPNGSHTLTAYPVAQDAAAFVEFLKTVFGAEEVFRAVSGGGGLHVEMNIGGSKLMLGGGSADRKWSGKSRPMAFHISVPDVDASYELAVKAGAMAITPPTDQFWGERTANIEDPFGNYWYIGTRQGSTHFFEGLPVLQPYLHPVKAAPEIDFMMRAFGAEELGQRMVLPSGKMEHTTLKFGESTLEMSEADGPYHPMPSMFLLSVPNADAAYKRALEAGAISVQEPVDQPDRGDRTAAVADPFGNSWYMAAKLH